MPNPLGNLFAEEITYSEKRRKIPTEGEEYENKQSFTAIIIFVIILVFGLGILLARTFTLTIIEGDRYRKLAVGNRVRETNLPSPRGIIYDRYQNPLVGNIPTFKQSDGTIFFENKPSTASSSISESVTRQYTYGELFAHVIGYIGEVEQQDINDQEAKSRYVPGDMIGKSGVERVYDGKLRGKDGKELVEVDALGQTVRVLGRVEPVVGKPLTLSLSLPLQKIASTELSGRKGAVIATIPQTGEALVLYSSPSFDPNAFIRGENIEGIFTDEKRPLFNRAISGLYPPGSTFKIVVALAALESGAITKETRFEDVGIIHVGNFSFSNWYFTQYGKKEGSVDIVTAIKRSNDIFFYKTGEAVGIDKLSQWAKKVGVGNLLGIDLPGEAEGVMPDPNWRKRVRSEDWYLGDTYHVAIGQGDMLTTPLQVNAWTNVIASDGKLCPPHVVSDSRKHCQNIGLKKETLELIREGMKQACSPAGTGWPLFKFKVPSSADVSGGKHDAKIAVDGIDFIDSPESTVSGRKMIEIPTACKTGTSEFGDPKGKTHAWFTVFAPVVHPQISVTVLVEGAGEGSNVAAPIAKKILEEWFTQ